MLNMDFKLVYTYKITFFTNTLKPRYSEFDDIVNKIQLQF